MSRSIPNALKYGDVTTATVVEAGKYTLQGETLYTFYALIPDRNGVAGQCALANGYQVGLADLSTIQIHELEFVKAWVDCLAEISHAMRVCLNRAHVQHEISVTHPRCVSLYDLRPLQDRIIDIYRQVPSRQAILKLQLARLLATFICRHHDIMLTTDKQRSIIRQFPNPYARSYALRRSSPSLNEALKRILPSPVQPAFIPVEEGHIEQ